MSSIFKAKRKANATKGTNNGNNNVELMDDNASQISDVNYTNNNDLNTLTSFASAPTTEDEVSIDFGKLSIEDKKIFAKATLLEQKDKERKEQTKEFNAI